LLYIWRVGNPFGDVLESHKLSNDQGKFLFTAFDLSPSLTRYVYINHNAQVVGLITGFPQTCGSPTLKAQS
jgi:hypothetical protein